MGQVESALSVIQPEDLVSWFPVDAVIHDGKPAIEWMKVAGVEFTEPFFHQTIQRVKAENTSQTLLTEFDLLLRAEKVFDRISRICRYTRELRCWKKEDGINVKWVVVVV